MGSYNMFCSSMIDDCIGIESCTDFRPLEEVMLSYKKELKDNKQQHCKPHEKLARKKKELPPPIPLLACTGNLQSHMPWALKRQYTSDGRLILTEEKVKHHEYFQVNRLDGRLTLHLVSLDDEVFETSSREEIHEDEACPDSASNEETAIKGPEKGGINGDDYDGEDQSILEISKRKLACSASDSSMEYGIGHVGSLAAGKCLKYNNYVRVSSVPAIRLLS